MQYDPLLGLAALTLALQLKQNEVSSILQHVPSNITNPFIITAGGGGGADDEWIGRVALLLLTADDIRRSDIIV